MPCGLRRGVKFGGTSLFAWNMILGASGPRSSEGGSFARAMDGTLPMTISLVKGDGFVRGGGRGRDADIAGHKHSNIWPRKDSYARESIYCSARFCSSVGWNKIYFPWVPNVPALCPCRHHGSILLDLHDVVSEKENLIVARTHISHARKIWCQFGAKSPPISGHHIAQVRNWWTSCGGQPLVQALGLANQTVNTRHNQDHL